MSDWETVTILRKKPPKASAMKSEQAINAARRQGVAVDTQSKWGAATNKQHVTTKNTAKLDRETEELKHDKVPLDLGRLIQQGRQARGWSQKELATVRRGLICRKFMLSKTAWKGTGQTCSAPWDQAVNLSLGARNSISLCPSKDKCWNCSIIYQDENMNFVSSLLQWYILYGGELTFCLESVALSLHNLSKILNG
ncbi:uncharacterized protein LOC110836275 isoform X1 [Zootermopsis nevadensis]|uniref:uncharacterized protein LOC110836275 isoform X1 n=1 Tax=Zootermopsis nevadensis TaxID=136037 RepID=UPI000B8E314E|nr:uncharacterized protein LOC110836275 isoform X1 [Zootermopsis nevadensis]XP_021933026.1 uncharacterized protein LOC110836275 isoform X1 [Zootermopsis nevadensis]